MLTDARRSESYKSASTSFAQQFTSGAQSASDYLQGKTSLQSISSGYALRILEDTENTLIAAGIGNAKELAAIQAQAQAVTAAGNHLMQSSRTQDIVRMGMAMAI